MTINICQLNEKVTDKTPQEIIKTVIEEDPSVFVTTNFSPYETVILHMLTQEKPDIDVLWIDSGLKQTGNLSFAESAIKTLHLNIKVFTPRITAQRLHSVLGGIPNINDDRHDVFTHDFKLEPFQRAIQSQTNKIWFTAVRREQTALRANMNYVDYGPFGLIKVAPLLDWTEDQLKDYIISHNLVNENNYFDPTKAEAHRECGLHTIKIETAA